MVGNLTEQGLSFGRIIHVTTETGRWAGGASLAQLTRADSTFPLAGASGEITANNDLRLRCSWRCFRWSDKIRSPGASVEWSEDLFARAVSLSIPNEERLGSGPTRCATLFAFYCLN